MTTSLSWSSCSSSTTGVICDLEHLANLLCASHCASQHRQKYVLKPRFFQGNRMKRNEEFEVELRGTRVTNLGRERLVSHSECCCRSKLEGHHSSRSQSQDHFPPHTRYTRAQWYKSEMPESLHGCYRTAGISKVHGHLSLARPSPPNMGVGHGSS